MTRITSSQSADAHGDAAFTTVWDGLRLEGVDVALDATIRPEALDRSRATGGPTVLSPTLPRLSIDLRDGTGEAASTRTADSDIVITGVLGQGGMGRVLLAHQRSLARDVAVKTVHEDLAGTAHADALVFEGLITGYLEHPNIPPVHQLGRDDEGRPLLVMKRITGVVWRELLEDPSHPWWPRVTTLGTSRSKAHLEILMQVCNGIAFAHSRRVVHRDIKPDNVMLGEFGEVYICDWGIATKLPVTAEHGLVGTPSYMAPEMLEASAEVGPRTDVYLLGGTLHTLLTGKPRHEGETVREVLELAFASEPAEYPPTVPRELGELANRATARDPADRPPTAVAFREALAAYFSHETSRALSNVAAARLAELGSGDAPPNAALAAIGECKHGFQQALREWAANADATEGLEQCSAAQFSLEIANENLAGARAALADMKAPLPGFSDELRSLADRLAERTAASDRLAAMRREEDLSLGARQRTLLLLVLIGVGALTALSMSLRKLVGMEDDENGAFARFVPTTVILATTSVGFALGRKQLLVNRVNRRIATVLVGVMCLELVHRLASWVRGDPLTPVLQTDMVLVAGALGASAVFLSPRWFVPAGALLASSLVALEVPSASLALFIASHMTIFVFMAFAWTNERRH